MTEHSMTRKYLMGTALAAAVVTGCSGPQVESATAPSIALVHAGGRDTQWAADTAAQHCREAGLQAQVANTQPLNSNFTRTTYQCVP
jgi:hypothetical protein